MNSWSQRFRAWHRWLAVVLFVQFAVWLLTALGMALIPRAWTTAYRATPDKDFSAVAHWPPVEELRARLDDQSLSKLNHLRLHKPGVRPIYTAVYGEPHEDVLLAPDATALHAPIPPEQIAAYASQITGTPILPSAVSVKHHPSPEYQGGADRWRRPIWRVVAPRATLFFDQYTGELRDQATSAKVFENTMKTVHVLDFAGAAQFRKNWVLTFAAIIFLLTALFGILSVRQILLLKRRGGQTSLAKTYRWHQALGLLLVIQVILQVSSGLSIVWLLDAARRTGEEHLRSAAEVDDVVDWSRVKTHPSTFINPQRDTRLGAAKEIALTMLLGRPVYQLVWPGRATYQELWDAERGEMITLTETDRDQLAARALVPESYQSITRWEQASQLDFYFFRGPFPVWKAHYEKPTPGVLAIDRVTGHVHRAPRTRREVWLELFYNTHVVNWRYGPVRYRWEPPLLVMIGLMLILLLTGAWLQLRRWRQQRKMVRGGFGS